MGPPGGIKNIINRMEKIKMFGIIVLFYVFVGILDVIFRMNRIKAALSETPMKLTTFIKAMLLMILLWPVLPFIYGRK